MSPGILLCPVNVSEGRSREVLSRLEAAAGDDLLDIHSDRDHNRSVLTVVGEAAARRLAEAAVAEIDLRHHSGVHPRFGAVDVVPFVPWEQATMADAVAARGSFAGWIGASLEVPAFAYGDGCPSLPEVRRRAFTNLSPDTGPGRPHPTAGACAVGARGPLVAFNVWVDGDDLARVRSAATAIRCPEIRALGLAVGRRWQVSMNLVEPDSVGPAEAYDRVAATGLAVAGAELVGLVPGRVLAAVPETRWPELDLSADRTVESRLAGWRARSGMD